MERMKKEELRAETLPGRILAKAVGKDGPVASRRMTVGYGDYCIEAGPMEPHRHAEECVFIIRSDRGFVRFGPGKDELGPRIALEAGSLLHFPPLEWHVFEYDDGGRVEILFIYGQVDGIRPEEMENLTREGDVRHGE